MAADPLERVMADACLGERTGDALAKDLRGFLETRGVPADDVEAIVSAPPRLAVYRSLVRNGLARAVVRMLPRTRSRMNAARAGRFDADLARFLGEVGPRTHYLRDVPQEFHAWVAPRWRADASVPRYLPDLAIHELAAFSVAAAAVSDESTIVTEIALDRSLRFAGSTRALRYDWAVHELPADEHATDPPVQRDVHVLAYRDAEHAVRWLELTPLAASIVERLRMGESLGAAIADACTDHDTAAPAVASEIAKLLADLGDRGVLLGARER